MTLKIPLEQQVTRIAEGLERAADGTDWVHDVEHARAVFLAAAQALRQAIILSK